MWQMMMVVVLVYEKTNDRHTISKCFGKVKTLTFLQS